MLFKLLQMMCESTNCINGLIKICENEMAFIKQEFLLEFLKTSKTTYKNPSNNPVTIRAKLFFYKKSNFLITFMVSQSTYR